MRVGQLVCLGPSNRELRQVCRVEHVRPDGVDLWVVNGEFEIRLDVHGILVPAKGWYLRTKILYVGPMPRYFDYNDLFTKAELLVSPRPVSTFLLRLRWLFVGLWLRTRRSAYRAVSSWKEPLEKEIKVKTVEDDDIPF